MNRILLAAILLLPLSARSQLKRTDENPAAKAIEELITAPAAKNAAPPKKSGADDLKEGGPTVVCDGKGGYRVEMNGKDGLIFASCLKKHEESHIADYVKTCPVGCKAQANGVEAPRDAPRCPPFLKAEDFNGWRADSECKAYGVERACLKELYGSVSDKSAQRVIRVKIRDAKCRLTKFKCPGRSESWDWYIENCK